MNNVPFENQPGTRGRTLFDFRASTFVELLQINQNAGGSATNTSIMTGTSNSHRGAWLTLAQNPGTAGTVDSIVWNGSTMVPAGQNGRPAANFRLGTTNYGGIVAWGVGLPCNFVNEDDYARISLAFRIDTGFSDDLGIVVGLGGLPVSGLNVTTQPIASGDYGITQLIAQVPTFMGISKQLLATPADAPFRGVFCDDGVADTSRAVSPNIAANVWYDLDLEFYKGKGANEGRMRVTIGQNSPWEGRYNNIMETEMRTSTAFPDADQTLMPLIAFLGGTTDSVSFSVGHVEAAAYRRPLR